VADVAAKGGLARAQSLTKAERSAIAKKAAEGRWASAKALPKETHSGVLKLGDGIPCAVLSNGMRVLSLSGLDRAFGTSSGTRRGDDLIPPMLAAANVRAFITPELMAKLSSPVSYQSKSGGRGIGYEAEILHKMVATILDARAAGVLRKNQLHIAKAAELLLRAFAEVGLVALIDEATGYQADRARDELQRILEAYISKELLPWTRKFPDDFFEQVYRLHGWKYQAGNAKRPQYVGHIINRYVYEPLPAGVLEELQRKNPPVINGRRRHKHFQFLSEDTGNPHLDRQIVAVTTIMKLADTKADFVSKFKRLYPRQGEQMDLALGDPELDAVTAVEQPLAVNGVPLTDIVQTVRSRILDCLRGGNTVGSGDIAMRVYGNRTESTLNKLRARMKQLKAEGIVDSPSKGIWKLVDTSAN